MPGTSERSSTSRSIETLERLTVERLSWEHVVRLHRYAPFLVARSALGFARWRLQRELWRRDVERLGSQDSAADIGGEQPAPVDVSA